jgi:SAM-dependent methyltransferase
MFKFGFSSDGAEETTNVQEEHDLRWLQSEEINPNEINIDQNVTVNSIRSGEFDIRCVSNEGVVDSLKCSQNKDNSLLSAEQNHSDLITAVYEGGLKIWECTYDLLNFINNLDVDLNNKKVLDLGCGAGIIGIFACLKGARTVFQDYNVEVIKSITIPNVSLNDINFDKCEFFYGDWESFLQLQNKALCENDKFDCIFTSETIYNINNYKKLINIFKNLLKKTGVVYVAAKCHYFGVGGGTGQFEDSLKKEDIFNHSTCWVCPNGVKRAIIKITLK